MQTFPPQTSPYVSTPSLNRTPSQIDALWPLVLALHHYFWPQQVSKALLGERTVQVGSLPRGTWQLQAGRPVQDRWQASTTANRGTTAQVVRPTLRTLQHTIIKSCARNRHFFSERAHKVAAQANSDLHLVLTLPSGGGGGPNSASLLSLRSLLLFISCFISSCITCSFLCIITCVSSCKTTFFVLYLQISFFELVLHLLPTTPPLPELGMSALVLVPFHEAIFLFLCRMLA